MEENMMATQAASEVGIKHQRAWHVIDVISEIFTNYLKAQREEELEFKIMDSLPPLKSQVETLYEQLKTNGSEVNDSIDQIEETLRELLGHGDVFGSIRLIGLVSGMKVFLENEQSFFEVSSTEVIRGISSVLFSVIGNHNQMLFLTEEYSTVKAGDLTIQGLLTVVDNPQGLIGKKTVGEVPEVVDSIANLMADVEWNKPVHLYYLHEVNELEISAFYSRVSLKTNFRQNPIGLTLFKLKGENGMPLYLSLTVDACTQAVKMEYAVEPGTRFEEYGWPESDLKQFASEYLFRQAFEKEELKSF